MVLFIGAAACQLGAQPASPDLQEKALQLLRQTISEDHARAGETGKMASPAATHDHATMAPGSGTTSTTGKPSHSAKPRATTKPAATGTQMTTPAAPMTAAPAQTTPEPTAGPKTKQQRLADLLELYKADKLTPPEYHSQRAKILAEP